MKCPKRYDVQQKTQETKKYESEDEIYTRIFVEVQEFRDCYKEECAFWNKEKERCGIINEN